MADVETMIVKGLLCESCCVVIDGVEPGFARLCPACKGEARDRRRRGLHPTLGSEAWPEPDPPELVDLDADGLELAHG